jgi:predicted phosphodiesterase
MMRIALLSDIHGNALALDAVLADIAAAWPFDHIVVAGDLVWSGPRPAEVVDRVRALRAIVVQGNTDAFLAAAAEETPDGKNAERFAAHLRWQRDRLGPERTGWLAALPFSRRITPPEAAPEGGDDLLIVHANPLDLEQAITERLRSAELDDMLGAFTAEQPWAVLAFGHYHVPFQREWLYAGRRHLLLNVASAGLPMDGDTRAAWASLHWEGTGWRAEHHRVFYDTRLVAHEMRSSDMPRGKHFAERLLSSTYEY